jgi:hypothetical protein
MADVEEFSGHSQHTAEFIVMIEYPDYVLSPLQEGQVKFFYPLGYLLHMVGEHDGSFFVGYFNVDGTFALILHPDAEVVIRRASQENDPQSFFVSPSDPVFGNDGGFYNRLIGQGSHLGVYGLDRGEGGQGKQGDDSDKGLFHIVRAF